jgi:hypothetical protein
MQENTSTDSEKATPCPWLSQLKPYSSQETFLEYLTQHYALIALNPQTIEIARYRTKELKKDFPTLGILVAQRIKTINAVKP